MYHTNPICDLINTDSLDMYSLMMGVVGFPTRQFTKLIYDYNKWLDSVPIIVINGLLKRDSFSIIMYNNYLYNMMKKNNISIKHAYYYSIRHAGYEPAKINNKTYRSMKRRNKAIYFIGS